MPRPSATAMMLCDLRALAQAQGLNWKHASGRWIVNGELAPQTFPSGWLGEKMALVHFLISRRAADLSPATLGKLRALALDLLPPAASADDSACVLVEEECVGIATSQLWQCGEQFTHVTFYPDAAEGETRKGPKWAKGNDAVAVRKVALWTTRLKAASQHKTFCTKRR